MHSNALELNHSLTRYRTACSPGFYRQRNWRELGQVNSTNYPANSTVGTQPLYNNVVLTDEPGCDADFHFVHSVKEVVLRYGTATRAITSKAARGRPLPSLSWMLECTHEIMSNQNMPSQESATQPGTHKQASSWAKLNLILRSWMDGKVSKANRPNARYKTFYRSI